MKANLEKMFAGTTFSDFLLKPQKAIVQTRRMVDLSMPLSRHADIAIPIIGANMDTVTGREMMNTLSLEGAFGFLDRNCSIEEEVSRAIYVKNQHSFVIEHPLIMNMSVQVRPLYLCSQSRLQGKDKSAFVIVAPKLTGLLK